MANFVYNISLGRGVEYYNRVKNNDPAASQFILVPLKVSPTQAESQDYDNLSLVLGGAADEADTANGWVRKSLTDAELAAFPAPDDAADRYDVSIPQVTWTTPGVGHNLTGILVCYSAVTPGVDTTTVPISHHDLAFTADGTNFVLNSSVFLRATH